MTLWRHILISHNGVKSYPLRRPLFKSHPGMTHLTWSLNYYINPLSRHDALKHHFTSLKTDLILQQPRVLERKFP